MFCVADVCSSCYVFVIVFFFQAEDGIRDLVRSRGLGDVYKRQAQTSSLRGGPSGSAGSRGMAQAASKAAVASAATLRVDVGIMVLRLRVAGGAAGTDRGKAPCLLSTSPSPRARTRYRMPVSA